MKLVASIFAFVLCLLTVQPLFISEPVNAEETSCCNPQKTCTKEEENQSEKQDDCRNMACNPFMSCVYGNFFVLDKQCISFDFFPGAKQKLNVYNDNRVIQNLSECWHPPEASA